MRISPQVGVLFTFFTAAITLPAPSAGQLPDSSSISAAHNHGHPKAMGHAAPRALA